MKITSKLALNQIKLNRKRTLGTILAIFHFVQLLADASIVIALHYTCSFGSFQQI